jgi:uncharacterized protein YjbJ (UPF0337 family)
MGKIEDTGDRIKGKAKETKGKATDDQSTENEGRADQAKVDIKDAGRKVKDAFTR